MGRLPHIALIGLLPLAVLCSCVRTTGPKGSSVVESVAVDGNTSVSDKKLVKGLATHPPRGLIRRQQVRLDRDALETDRKRIETYYRSMGFYSSEIAEPEVKTLANERVAVRFDVEEGDASLVSSIQFQVAEDVPEVLSDELRTLVSLQPGDRFVHDKYLASKDAILKHLVTSGYAYAKVNGEVHVHPEKHEAAIVLHLAPGPRARFGETRVKGLDRVSRSAVMNRLAWSRGAVFDAQKLHETRARLYELRVFSTVRVDFDPTAPSAAVPMRITVAEAARRTLRLGAGVGVDRVRWEVRARAGYEVVGVWGMPLTTLLLEARPAYALIRGIGGEQGFVGEANAALRREDFLLPLVRGGVRIGYAVDEIEAYTAQSVKFGLSMSRWFLHRRLQLAVGYQIQATQFLSVSDAIDESTARELGLKGPYRLAMLEQSATYDRRDDPITPHRGYYADLRIEEAAPYWASEFSYVSVKPDLRGYLPLGGRATIAARTHLGLPLTGDRLPITRRFFGGGATGQRGFAQRQLSPVATAEGKTVGIGGSALWESSLELRIDTMQIMERWLALAAFADAGDVRREIAELEPGNPHVAVGGGLRYHTPVGPLRFDIGYRLNRTGPEEPAPGERWAFHFTLGEAF